MATAPVQVSAFASVRRRATAGGRHWPAVTAALAVAGFFLSFSLRAVDVHFSSDEVMNIYWYWEPGAWRVLWANIVWCKIIRPMGGVYYLPLFHLFGFNPWPYTVVRLAVLLFVSLLLLRLGKRLTGSTTAAALAVMLVTYHSELVSLTHSGSCIYDVLCGGFCFGALVYYLNCRASGRHPLSRRQSTAFLLLYICALNSKEMAVSLPVLVCAYEFLEATRGAGSRAAIARRFLVHAWPLAAAVMLTALFIVFNIYGPAGLARIDVYHPVFTWARFTESSQRFLNAIFCVSLFRTWSVLAVWILLAYVGVRKDDRRLLFLLVWVVATPLPLNFIPPHGPGCVYIPLVGWSMIVATITEAIARRVAREPVFARIPQQASVICILAGALAYYTSLMEIRHKAHERVYFSGGVKTWNIIEQFRVLRLRPPHGARIALMNDPFPEGWDTFFIANLTWKDRSLGVFLQNQQHLPAKELALMDYVFDFPSGRLTRIKP
jgi:hypothetical protein